ncbi:uncharacterized protein LOC117639275 [Thrips palmi]|uniref:Uncharacterized protein LOC117639275 n=1 Tax=Thrips palmi TaxID=161013 RepID=A0A6P8YAB0_THRPL|nr:uncharacterized protein LOC117639275 [Thrips palmi]
MSASRSKFLASKTKRKEESDEEDYDSEEERYRWKQQRLLKKVEESASAIRAVNEITRPFVTGTWRLEREEQRIAAATMASTSLSKENKLHPASSSRGSESWNEKNDATDKADSHRRKSIWSPIKHVKTTDVQSVLEMEKTPTWKPLRKSKARQSLALFNTENARNSVDDDDITSACKPLSDKSALEKTPVLKGPEEVRTPLRDVVGLNQAVGRRKSLSISNDTTPAPPADSDDATMNDPIKVENIVRENHPVEIMISDSDLSGGTPSRSSSMEETEVITPVTQTRSFLKSYKSPVRCSPILLQAYGEEFAKVRGSIGSPDKVVNLNECSSPKDASKVLKGVTAYVEVRRGEDDRTGGFRWKLKQLGANVSDTLNKKVTHVVFQEGLLSTFRKAKQIGAHLVSTHWVMACDESFSKIDEARYPIEKLEQYEFADPLQKSIKRPKIMSPDLGTGRDDKLLSKRLQRRSIRVDSPLTKPNVISTFKTPSPLKRMNYVTRSSPSPKKLLNEDSNDDWDGFLAMVEAQVREKAESRRKTGEMNGTHEDFETRLQRLLGQDKDNCQAKPPLASIFQRGKVSTNVTTKPSPKRTKEAKKPMPTSDSTSRNSFMMSWLQSRSPEKGGKFGSCDLSSAATAASAAADAILKSMFKSTLSTTESRGKPAAKVVNGSNKSLKTSKTTPNEPFVFGGKPENAKAVHFVFAGKSENTKAVSQSAKKPIKKSKFEFQGSTACSGVMRNWLSGAKSPTQLTKNPLNKHSSPLKVSKRAAEIDLTDEINDSLKPSKRHCGEVTPVKQATVKDSAMNSDRKKLADLTPRRRSMRLTPIKSTSLQSNITQLETLQENTLSTFNQGAITPRKQSVRCSVRETPDKSGHRSVSKKTATPSKH